MRAFRLLHLVARRGNSREFPENTLPALRSAIQLGARFIEIDVHLSADGVPMVAHDRELTRVEGLGDLSAAQLAAFDVSQPEIFGQRFRGTHLQTLGSTLELLEGRPEITVFVIIGRISAARFGHEQVVSQVTRVLKPFRSRCVVGSMDLPTVHKARLIAGCPIAWVLPAYDDHTRLKYEALQPEYVFCNRELLPAQGPLWRGPWRWAIYEVDALETALQLAERGADFVVTRDVRTLGEAMRSHAAANAPSRAFGGGGPLRPATAPGTGATVAASAAAASPAPARDPLRRS